MPSTMKLSMATLAFRLDLEPPLLILRFPRAQRTFGWSITKPGFDFATEIVWLEVRDNDLALHVEPVAFAKNIVSGSGFLDPAVFMTSREIERHHLAQSTIGSVTATCVTTVGLSNGEKVGMRRNLAHTGFGTINTLVHVSRPLVVAAFVEAISIATQARTAAIMETNDLRDSAPITGTGTDCIIIAAPDSEEAERCAGLHTDPGEAIGTAVYEATLAGAKEWSAEQTGQKV